MFDITAEEPVALEKIAKHCHTSYCSVWRWVLKGLPGPDGQRVRLEGLRVGCRWVSSWPALQRFVERTTPHIADDASPVPRSASKRQRASEKAAAILEKMGA